MRQQLQGGVDPKALNQMMAIIKSMTVREREEPEIIKGSRRRRIAKGSGVRVEEVNLVLSQFRQMKQMLAQFTDKGAGLGKGIRLPKL
jgi:signal recognition particle subunit SRP54